MIKFGCRLLQKGFKSQIVFEPGGELFPCIVSAMNGGFARGSQVAELYQPQKS